MMPLSELGPTKRARSERFGSASSTCRRGELLVSVAPKPGARGPTGPPGSQGTAGHEAPPDLPVPPGPRALRVRPVRQVVAAPWPCGCRGGARHRWSGRAAGARKGRRAARVSGGSPGLATTSGAATASERGLTRAMHHAQQHQGSRRTRPGTASAPYRQAARRSRISSPRATPLRPAHRRTQSTCSTTERRY
jgi:hypothetical protein